MNKRGSGATIETPASETATEAPTAAPIDPFEGVSLKSPLLQVMQQLLGPFLEHRGHCALALRRPGEGCSCGLQAAVASLSQREMMITRYGSTE
jgi:hypothetical protein